MSTFADTMQENEARLEDERELRGLLRAAEIDDRLTADQRHVVIDRAAHYLGDLLWKRREVEGIARGELDVVAPQR